MLTIIEGTDCSGKSTAVKLLLDKEENKNIIYKHFPPVPKDWEGDAYSYWNSQLLLLREKGLKDSRFLVDRGIISNHVYGSYKQDQKYIILQELRSLLAIFSEAFGGINIYLFHCSEEELRKRINERGEEYLTPNEAVNIQKTYRDCMEEIERFNNPRVKVHIMPQNVAREEIVKLIQL